MMMNLANGHIYIYISIYDRVSSSTSRFLIERIIFSSLGNENYAGFESFRHAMNLANGHTKCVRSLQCDIKLPTANYSETGACTWIHDPKPLLQ